MIPSLLRYTWIAQFDPNADCFVFRLAGESVNEVWGRGLKARTMRELVGESDYPLIRERWMAILEKPAIQYGAPQRKLSALDSWHAERLVLPMISDCGATDLLLGVSFYSLDHILDSQNPNPTELVRQFPCSSVLDL